MADLIVPCVDGECSLRGTITSWGQASNHNGPGFRPWNLSSQVYVFDAGNHDGLMGLCLVTQLCPTLCDPMDCSPPGSYVYGILQARILEWVPMLTSRGSFQPRDQTYVTCSSCTATGFFTTELPGKLSACGTFLKVILISFFIIIGHATWHVGS